MSKPRSKAEGLFHVELEEARRWYQLGAGTWKEVRKYYKRQRNKAARRQGKKECKDE